MHLCENCHQFVDDNSEYCAKCGTPQNKIDPSSAPVEGVQVYPPLASSTMPPPYPTFNGPSSFQANQYSIRKVKNRWLAAGLNFFLPGAGYIYNGVGRDKTQLIFGIIVLIAVFVGFYVPILGSLLTVPASTSAPVPTIQFLQLLLLILPLGLAYDAYRRAG